MPHEPCPYNTQDKYKQRLICVSISNTDILYGFALVLLLSFAFITLVSAPEKVTYSTDILAYNGRLLSQATTTIHFISGPIKMSLVRKGSQSTSSWLQPEDTWYGIASKNHHFQNQIEQEFRNVELVVKCTFENLEFKWSESGYCLSFESEDSETEKLLSIIALQNGNAVYLKWWTHIWGSDPSRHSTTMQSVLPSLPQFNHLTYHHPIYETLDHQ